MACLEQINLNGTDYKLLGFPVGSIYMSADNTSPASLIGGTWEALGVHYLPKGVVPVKTTSETHGTPFYGLWFLDVNGNIPEDNKYLTFYHGQLYKSSGAGSADGFATSITNMWAINNDNTYNTAIYLWKRVA